MTSDGQLEALETERLAVQARDGQSPAQTIRDAATLIIVDEAANTEKGGEPRFLMGLRGRAHVFMANRFVFPGGRVDDTDRDFGSAFTLSADVVARLGASVAPGFGARDAAGLALAAIRETYEETGLLIAHESALSSPYPTEFAAFAERGMTPAVDWLVPVARAITPEGSPRRFDTRFFVINASRIGTVCETFTPPTDEFDTIRWVSTGALDDHSLAPITRTVLGDLANRMADGSWLDAAQAMPFYRIVDGRFQKDLI